MTLTTQRYISAIAAAVGMHAVAAVALALADVEVEADDSGDETEVALEEIPPPPPPPTIEEPEPEPEPTPPPEPEPVKEIAPKPEPEPEPTPPPEPAKAAEPVVPSTDEPAPGAPSPVAPGGVIQMDDIAPAGTMKVRPSTGGRVAGPGGPGEGTGGGGTGEGTGPPRPVSIASIKRKAMPIGDTDYANLGKSYPPEALKRRIEGDVVVKLIVDAGGAVTSRTIVKGPGFGLNKRALALARKLRFKPAIDTNDKPVTSVVVWTFTFALPD